MFVIEVCADSYTSAVAGKNGGAQRIELCANLAEGGTTQSFGQIAACVSGLDIPVYPIIRPRGGDFVYSDDELDIMKADVLVCKELKCAGIVTGILTPQNTIDVERCKELIEIAKPMKVVFHKAFDLCEDKADALETLIELGFERVLTAGGKQNALEGMYSISHLVTIASGRITIMPGGGVNESNISILAKETGAREFHGTFKTNNPTNSTLYCTDESHVANVVQMLKKISD